MGGPTFVKSFIPMREVVCAEIISSENGWIEENLTAPDDFGIGGEKWRDLRQGGEDWRPTRLSSVSVSTINRDTGHSDVRLHSGVDWWLWWREWWTLVTSFQDLIKYGGRGGGGNLFPTTSAFPQGYLVTRSKILTRSGKSWWRVLWQNFLPQGWKEREMRLHSKTSPTSHTCQKVNTPPPTNYGRLLSTIVSPIGNRYKLFRLSYTSRWDILISLKLHEN